MERFQLSRKEMSDFLLALNDEGKLASKVILQRAWDHNKKKPQDGSPSIEPIESEVPAIFMKLLKSYKHPMGFSLNDIVQLGNQIEFSQLSSTTVQNWVKRDVKELIGAPQIGRKYTVDQVAILLIVEDLKVSLDFDSIRKILKLIFNNPTYRYDDIVRPIHFYRAYATMFDLLDRQTIGIEDGSFHLQMEKYVCMAAEKQWAEMKEIDEKNKETVLKVLITSTLCVFTSYYRMLSGKYVTGILFKQGL